VKTKIACFALALAIVWAMKRYYSGAAADDLWWILGPTARIAGGITGAAFQFAPGEGYLSRERLFLIEKSCAGINFMIAAFALLTYALRRHVRSVASAAGVLGLSLMAGYAAAVAVNAARIAFAMWLAGKSSAFSLLTPAQLHRLEGITVYFAGLVLLYELALRMDRTVAPSQAEP
jgi:exosortase K